MARDVTWQTLPHDTSCHYVDGMRVLVTGATRGLGLATARTLARRGADVVVSGRDPAAVTRVAGEIGGTPLVLDLARPTHVREVAAELPALDAVVANAGVQFAGAPTFTADGVEETLAINVLGHVVLLDALMAGPNPPGEVVLLGSGTHLPGEVPFIPDPVEDLDLGALARGEAAAESGPQRYSTSKLHTTALTGAYARAYPDTFWTCYDPGLMTDTGLARDRPAWQQQILPDRRARGHGLRAVRGHVRAVGRDAREPRPQPDRPLGRRRGVPPGLRRPVGARGGPGVPGRPARGVAGAPRGRRALRNSEAHESLAEAGGFEPPVTLVTSAFKADAIGRSATLPRARVGRSAVGAQLGHHSLEHVADDAALVVVEEVDEVGPHALEVIGRGALEDVVAVRGEDGEHAPAVGGAELAAHEVVGLEAGHLVRQA